MMGYGRKFGITVVAYFVGFLVSVLAIVLIIDVRTISLDSGLPMAAMTTPMIAVVVFWGVARALGAHIKPVQTFLFGGIAVYSLLYLCGRLVANGLMSNSGATSIGAMALFLLCYHTVTQSDQTR